MHTLTHIYTHTTHITYTHTHSRDPWRIERLMICSDIFSISCTCPVFKSELDIENNKSEANIKRARQRGRGKDRERGERGGGERASEHDYELCEVQSQCTLYFPQAKSDFESIALAAVAAAAAARCTRSSFSALHS